VFVIRRALVVFGTLLGAAVAVLVVAGVVTVRLWRYSRVRFGHRSGR
jgi:hypothetical protein